MPEYFFIKAPDKKEEKRKKVPLQYEKKLNNYHTIVHVLLH